LYKRYRKEGDKGVIHRMRGPKARGYSTFKNFKAVISLLTGKLDYTKAGLPT
jgi:hypothetical protein